MGIARIAFVDGTVYRGRSVGAEGTTGGEAVFNTGMTGYQEVLTDPSYRGQIITMTYPEIGNYGVNAQDLKSDELAFSREFDTPYVSVRDRGNRTHQDYGLTGVPETYYLDADGRIVGHTPDAISRASVERVIAQAIGGAAR